VTDTIEVLQVPSEFRPLERMYRETRPARILEIGSWQGGTLRVWLTQADPSVVVAVDLDHQRPDLYGGWRKRGCRLHTITGDSQTDEIKDEIRRLGPYDWLFVDGDHAEEAVRSDVALAMEVAAPGATLVLHDIARGALNEGSPGPRVVLEELRARGLEVTEFVEEPYDGNWAHGIGVVRL